MSRARTAHGREEEYFFLAFFFSFSFFMNWENPKPKSMAAFASNSSNSARTPFVPIESAMLEVGWRIIKSAEAEGGRG